MKQSTIRHAALTAGVAFAVLAAAMALIGPAATGTVAAQTNGTANDTANATATVEYNDQTIDGENVVVERVNLSNGGYVAIYDEGGSLVGHSDYLGSGEQTNVTVTLDEALSRSQVTVATVHTDDGNREFNESANAPYRDGGAPVSSTAYLTVEGGSEETTTTTTSTDETTTSSDGASADETTADSSDSTTSTDGPGFGVVAALVGLLAAVAIALRRD
ncbi:DUF7282 domain-containing protein [Haloprofundus salilacus]|uniref:DUF7282 domain-containing protein n=1 Tax=Haloprofundus salilacus TaxID=2876190 RepID=UPI001CC9584D|nr:PGF-CTERM sorting domain-containing protein [Haloprofundus salilacus]